MIIALGRVNLTPSVEATEVKCEKCKVGDLVFLTPLTGEASDPRTSVEAYNAYFVIHHNAGGGNCSFGYMVVRCQ